MKDYRIYARLDPEVPGDQRIIEKIKKRNKLMHRNVSDYVRHALAAYEEGLDQEQLMLDIRKNVRMEMRAFYEKNAEAKQKEEDEFPLFNEF